MKRWFRSKAIIIGILEVAGGLAASISGMLREGVPFTVAGVIQILIRLATREAIGKDK